MHYDEFRNNMANVSYLHKSFKLILVRVGRLYGYTGRYCSMHVICVESIDTWLRGALSTQTLSET